MGLLLLGLNTALFSACEFVASPVLGQLADRYGRKPLLQIALGGTAASYMMLAVGIGSKSLPLIFLARAVDGLTGGNTALFQSAVADVVPKEERAKVFGRFEAAFSAGFVVGPLMGGLLSDPRIARGLNPAVPMWVSGAIALANVFFIGLRFQEALREPSREGLKPAEAFTNVREAFHDGRLRAAYVTVMLFSGGFAFFMSFFNVLLQRRFHFDQREIGFAFALIGGGGALVQTFLVGPAKRRFGGDRLVLWAVPVASAVLLAAALVPSVGLLAGLLPLYAVSTGLVRPNLSSIVSERAGDRSQGRALGIQASLDALGWAVPPVIAGGLAAGLGPSAPIVAGAATMLGAWFAFRKAPPPESARVG